MKKEKSADEKIAWKLNMNFGNSTNPFINIIAKKNPKVKVNDWSNISFLFSLKSNP